MTKMKPRSISMLRRATLALAAAATFGAVQAQEVTLKAVNAFQEGTYFARNFERCFGIIDEAVTEKPYRVMSVTYDRFAKDLSEGLGEELVDRDGLLRVLKNYLESNRMKADWPAIQRASSEVLINALSVMCPYGPEEKQALLEAADLKTRADVLVALAEFELASNGSSGSTLQ